MVFVSGAHTNLAQALRLNPAIKSNIRSVTIMGGSLDVPGNIEGDWTTIQNKVAEWNIFVDPLAAQEVFAAGIPLRLVPLDATNRVTWTRGDLPAWTASGSPEGARAAELLAWTLDSWRAQDVLIWDLVTAVTAAQPAVCPWVARAVEVVIQDGPEQGRTRVTDGAANVSACLEPDVAQVKAIAASILGGK